MSAKDHTSGSIVVTEIAAYGAFQPIMAEP